MLLRGLALLTTLLCFGLGHAAESDFDHVAAYEAYLDIREDDYTDRRRELLNHLGYIDEEKREALSQLLRRKDKAHLSIVFEIIDLWALRYRKEWGEPLIVDVADRATELLSLNHRIITSGPSQDLSVILAILIELQLKPEEQYRAAYERLYTLVEKIQAEASHKEQSRYLRNKLLESVKEQQAELHRQQVEGLEQATRTIEERAAQLIERYEIK